MITPSTDDKDMAAAVAPPATGAREWLRRAWGRCARYLARRRSRWALAELGGRSLQDIGLTREDVRRSRAGEGALESKHWRWAAN
jgi:uncharacterized protein YjiS (DUF1127 family)